jgi:thioesterase domain-containing protein
LDTSTLTQEVRQAGDAHLLALRRYRPEPCRLPITVYRASNQGLNSLLLDESLGWGAVANGKVINHEMPGDHGSIIAEPLLGALTAELSKGLVGMDASVQTLSLPWPAPSVSVDAVTLRPG